jgi:hypothetical protein
MPKKIDTYGYDKNTEERFLSDAILDLQRGLTTYVYKERYLDRLKQIFDDLDIKKCDFYWSVRNKERKASRVKLGRGRPKKEVSK